MQALNVKARHSRLSSPCWGHLIGAIDASEKFINNMSVDSMYYT
jgi:hypothetical protein